MYLYIYIFKYIIYMAILITILFSSDKAEKEEVVAAIEHCFIYYLFYLYSII